MELRVGWRFPTLEFEGNTRALECAGVEVRVGGVGAAVVSVAANGLDEVDEPVGRVDGHVQVRRVDHTGVDAEDIDKEVQKVPVQVVEAVPVSGVEVLEGVP